MSEGNLVLCGPIVRRVERASVSVFVVTREPCTVELTVHAHDGGQKAAGPPLLRGSRATIKLGDQAHAAVVTATASSDALLWGASYLYDLAFVIGQTRRGLCDDGVLVAKFSFATDLSRLRYEGYDLPSFALPPEDPAELRLLHGSCRKPHGDGKDAMKYGDRLLELALESPANGPRPQQLFLTGDQIYADDVHLNLLTALSWYSRHALGGREESQELVPALDSAFDPGSRESACHDAGLSSGACSSHLLSLGEFYAMYLFGWSHEPWPPVVSDPARAKLRDFYDALPAVRRLLANTATYMIFDDHEITDDWYIREGWRDSVLASWLGRKIVRNGLAAYLVFQHWGNDPAACAPGTPGGRALELLDGWTGEAATMRELDRLLPVPERGAALDAPDPGRIDWSWRWAGPGYQVVALDTRTRRAFDKGKTSLMSVADLEAALSAPPDGLRFSLILSAAPVLGVALLEWVQKKAARLGWGLKLDDEPWGHSGSYRRLLELLLARSPALVLSGDVHFGFGASLFDKKQPETRVVSLTSSALKNRSGKLARAGLWGLGFATDNHLQSALEAGGGQLCVATAREVPELSGGEYVERLIVDGDVVTTGALAGDQPEVALQGASSNDRTDITGHNNLGEIRLDPAAHELVQHLWYCDNDDWKSDRQVSRFWLRSEP